MNFYDYKEKYFKFLENGRQRCKGIRLAIDAALETQDIDNALRLYYEFISEDNFESDSFQAIIIFPEYLALFEKYPEYQDHHIRNLMWAFKWVAGSSADFYQIPLQQISDIYSQYESYCTKYHYNKRSLYRNMWNDMLNQGIASFPLSQSITDCHKKMNQYPKDGLSEPESGEIDDLVKYLLFVKNDIEAALDTAEPIFSGRQSCNVVPHYTYTNFAKYYFENGDIESARFFAEKALRIINRDFGGTESMGRYKGMCISVFAFCNIRKSLKFFKGQIRHYYTNQCGLDNFYFYRGAYHLFMQLEKSGEDCVSLNFPFRDDDIYSESGKYAVSQLKEYFFEKTKYIADRFDERNHNSHFNYILTKEYQFNE